MTDYKTYSLRRQVVDEAVRLAEQAGMGFNSNASVIHWALREGIEKLRHAVIMRKELTAKDDVLVSNAAEIAEES